MQSGGRIRVLCKCIWLEDQARTWIYRLMMSCSCHSSCKRYNRFLFFFLGKKHVKITPCHREARKWVTITAQDLFLLLITEQINLEVIMEFVIIYASMTKHEFTTSTNKIAPLITYVCRFICMTRETTMKWLSCTACYINFVASIYLSLKLAFYLDTYRRTRARVWI